MNEKNFNELLESIREVGLIEAGKQPPRREFVMKKELGDDLPNVKTFAICLSSHDENLIPLKIYNVVLQLRHDTCTVRDENDEVTVCPIEWFLPIEFPSSIERLIEEAELALG